MIFANVALFALSSALALVDAAPTPLLPIIRRSTSTDTPAGPTSYIVSIKSDTVNPLNRGAWLDKIFTAAGASLSDDEKATLRLGWNETVFNGLSGVFNTDALNVLRAQENVQYIQESVIMRKSALVNQADAPWGIARLSTGAKHLPTGSNPKDNFSFIFEDSAGEGTDVYVLDTGIRTTHKDFGGRADMLKSFIDNEDATTDLDGHGTHCAGTIGGSHFGVAKRALIHGIKVLDATGAGSDGGIISGLSFATQHALAHGRPSVFSLSLGGGVSPALDDAIRNAVKSGIVVVVAAGNDGTDASQNSPARVEEAITVGAIDIKDTVASFSNTGSIVDLFAPGVQVTSAGIDTDTDAKTFSGTSMACPHVAGLAATVLSLEGKMTPDQLQSRLKQLATASLVGGTPTDTVNAIAFNGVAFRSK